MNKRKYAQHGGETRKVACFRNNETGEKVKLKLKNVPLHPTEN